MTPQSDSHKLAAEQLLTRRTMLKASAAGSAALLLAGAPYARASQVREKALSSVSQNLIIGTTSDLIPADFIRTGSNPLLNSLVWDTLAVLDAKTLTPTPSVAKSWTWNKAETEITIDLRDDVRYHSGRLLEPADVIFAIKEEENPTYLAQVGPTAELIDKFTVSGKHQLKLKLAKPMSAFGMLLVLTPLIDRETVGNLFTGKQVIGTGPFVFKSWTPETSYSFTRNAKYWQKGLPHLTSITANVYSSQTALTQALQASEVDMAYSLTPSEALLLTQGGSYEALTSKPAYSEWYIGVNVQAPPFDNLQVRQAVAYALDRPRIVQEAFSGYGNATCIPWSVLSGIPSSWTDYYGYEPEKAKALLKEAGVSKPEITILTGSGNATQAAILNIAEYCLNAVGFNVNSQVIASATFTAELTGATIPGLWINSVGLTYLELGTVLLGNAPFKVGDNSSNVTDPAYAKLANAVVFARTPAESSKANKALTQYVLEQAWHLTVGHSPGVSAAVKNLTGIINDGANAMSATNAKFT